MNEEYDVVVLGTGLSECILSGLMSVSGKKVLHTDNNPYYGGESASLNLNDMFEKYKDTPPPANLGNSRDYCIDLTMKLIMAGGDMVKKLIATTVSKYLSLRQVEESHVYRACKLYKVPTTKTEFLTSSLIGFFQKKNLYSFVDNLSKCDFDKCELPQGLTPKSTMKDVYEKYGVNSENQELIGHVMALHQNDDYLNEECLNTLKRVRLYETSLAAHGKSPYLYPEYGLGDLPQSFARLSAVFNGVFMLNQKFENLHFDDCGNVDEVHFAEGKVKTKCVIASPSYFPERVQTLKQIVRCICILNHPIRGLANSCQIIIPASQVKRKHDIYVSVISSEFKVAPTGMFIAIVATEVESKDPALDVKVGVNLLEPILEKFMIVSDYQVPLKDGKADNVYITKSLDASTHFESTTVDVDDVWKRITGSDFNAEAFEQKVKQISEANG